MDLLIKGLSMPDEGCHHTICVYSDGKVETGEPNSYKAIPVPPHGRLGDLDELAKGFREIAEANSNWRASPTSWAHAYYEAEELVDEAPTIIPADEEGDT